MANFYITQFIHRSLLEIGSDPCNKNKKLQTPYAAANDKKTRNTFRRFMETYPDKFNYQKVLFITILFITEYIAINIKRNIIFIYYLIVSNTWAT